MTSENNLKFKCFSDPTHSLQKWLKEQGLINIIVTTSDEDDYFQIKKYPHGLVQPAVLVVKPDMTVLAKWEQVRTEENIQGAKDRRPAAEIWKEAKENM